MPHPIGLAPDDAHRGRVDDYAELRKAELVAARVAARPDPIHKPDDSAAEVYLVLVRGSVIVLPNRKATPPAPSKEEPLGPSPDDCGRADVADVRHEFLSLFRKSCHEPLPIRVDALHNLRHDGSLLPGAQALPPAAVPPEAAAVAGDAVARPERQPAHSELPPAGVLLHGNHAQPVPLVPRPDLVAGRRGEVDEAAPHARLPPSVLKVDQAHDRPRLPGRRSPSALRPCHPLPEARMPPTTG
uniref:Uncharacterized protein n=1 Tax=Tetraselmis sp. GSL018 TaxID=582737 RepID=A0A061QYI2_9CHLO